MLTPGGRAFSPVSIPGVSMLLLLRLYGNDLHTADVSLSPALPALSLDIEVSSSTLCRL